MSRSFIKDLVSVFTSKAAVIAFGLGTSIVTARYLSPSGNGVVASLMVYPILFLSIGSLGIRQSTTYFTGQQKYSLHEIYSSVVFIWLFSTVFCMGSCFILIRYFAKGDYPLNLVLLSIAPIPFSLYNTYSSGIFLGKQDIKAFNRINWIPTAITFGCTILCVAIFSFDIPGAMLASFLGVFVFFFFVMISMRRRVSFQFAFNGGVVRDMLRLGVVYAVSLLVINLNYRVNIILLERWSSPYEVGIYSKGANIIQYLWEVPMLLSTLVFSRSAAAVNPRDFSLRVCRLLRFSGIAIAALSVVLYFTSDLVIAILYGEKFAPSASVLRMLMPGVLLLTVFKVLNMDLAGKGKPWISMKAMVPAVVLNIGLNYWLIPLYQANGSSLASTISYGFAALLFLYVYSREMKIPMKDIFRFTDEDKTFFVNQYNKIKRSVWTA